MISGQQELSDAQLLRYSRHILLNEIGTLGQEALLRSHVLMVGAGGLGSPVALYLGGAGVGRITVLDADAVDETNLQRQIAHRLSSVGQAKVESFRAAVAAINPDVQVRALRQSADSTTFPGLLGDVDAVVDCCDNFATRQLINRACVQAGLPWVSGAAIRWGGQISVYDPRREDSPCYACVFPAADAPPEEACVTMGVLAPLVGILGSMQAAETLKLLLGLTPNLVGRLQMLDAREMRWTELRLRRNPHCEVCGGTRAQ